VAALLEVKGVSKSFGGLAALVDVSFTLEEGEILGLIGPNGAGKSTLFGCIAGALRPDRGEIRFAGKPIQGLGAERVARLGIGRTFQVMRSFENLSVLENVLIGSFRRHPRLRPALAHARTVLARTGLLGREEVAASALTPAEKRRLEIARALATEPRLLLLDETLTGLTPLEAEEGVALLRTLRAEGLTLLMVEHVMEILLPLVDRVVVLDLGRVLTIGTPAEVVQHPETIQAYFGERRAGG
jgi:branched-chain amino acid transport system ATP-binding protein